MEESTSQINSSGNGSSESSDQKHFLVAGIGASAGGVQALKEFFENVPADSGVAYVVILHLSPDYDSQLTNILQSVSKIPVIKVSEKVKVKPNHVYVVPPNESLHMLDDNIIIEPIHTIEERRAPVDIFFRSLAESQMAHAVAVVLSGTGANGSMGLKRVKERGGVVFVQNPRESEYSDMPRNAIATELVDEILNVKAIPEKIITYKESIGTVEIPVLQEALAESQQAALREIFTQLRVRTGHDFSNYKRATVLRRLERRINVRGLHSLQQYATFLSKTPEEAQALLKDLLISVTNFFRDKEAFDFLETNIIPRILQGKQTDDQVRIWVAGCATGEEAYSIAMLLYEKLQNNKEKPTVQIFATDIDDTAIANAREGFYTLNDAADVLPGRLRHFFVAEADGYRIKRELREMILFANHNVIKDPPFSRIDMITCRNMLIYLNQAAQNRVMETFHFALNPGGFLFLGSSESVDGANDLYVAVSKEHNVFQSRQATSRPIPVPDSSLPASFRVKLPDQGNGEVKNLHGQESRAVGRISFNDLHQRLLEQYAPPSLVVNENYDVVHVSESAGRFLEIAGGEPDNNILKLIKPGLRLELRTALYQAVQKQSNVEIKNLPVQTNGHTATINLHVRPVLRHDDTARGFILIIFEPAQEKPARDVVEIVPGASEPVTLQLEEEINNLRSQLRSSSEQFEVQTEELKASNEELQAMNEELRSAAEELETSKEELQSINEELITVNQELKVKIEELSQSNNNFQNLINSIDIGTIFLDRHFRVKLFTPAVHEIFNLIQADLGRPLSDITSQLEYDGLLADAEAVLQKLQPIEREVSVKGRRTYLMQIQPYRTAEDRISGVVIAFVNITRRKQAEDALRESEQRLQKAISIETVGVIFFDMEGKIHDANVAFQRMSGYAHEDFIKGKVRWDVTTPPEFMEATLKSQKELLTIGQNTPYEKQYIRPDGTRWWGLFAGKRLNENEYVEFVIDITDSKETEEALRENEERFRTLTNAVPQVIWTNEADGTATFFNQRWYEYSGLSYEQSAGVGWLAMVHPDDELTSAEQWQQALAKGEIFDTEYRLRRADGVYRWHIGRNVPLRNDKQEIVGWFGSATDVEDLKTAQEALHESEERYRAIVSQTSVGIVRADTNGNLVFLNEKACSMFGWSAADREDKTIQELTAPEDVEENKQLYEHLITEGFPFQYEKKLKRTDGSLFWASVSVAPIKDTAGKTQSAVAVIVDITGRKQAEEALRETMERFQYAVLATKDVIWEIDFVKDRVWWSSMMHTLFGYSQREVQHSVAWYQSLIHPDDRKRVAKSFEEAIHKKEGLWTDEFRFRQANGTYVYVTNRSLIIRNAKEKATRMIGALQDITERRQAEEAVRKSEERLRVTMQSATDYVIITMDTERIIERWNAGAERIFGYKAAEVIGKSGDLIFTPEDRAAGAPQQEMNTAKEHGRAADERWHLRKNGSRFFMSGVLSPIFNNNVLTGYVKLARDMTAQKQAEETLLATQNSLNTALQAAKMGVWDLDLITGIVTRSERHDQLLGYATLQEEWSMDKARQYLVAEDKPKFDAAYQQMLTTGIFELEARVQHTNGDQCWVHYFGRVFKNEKGEPTHAAGVIFDITDRKCLDQKKDEFIGIASHELKTPVTSIKAYTEILYDKFVEAGDHQSAVYLKKLNTQVDRLTRLIRDLLDATRISEGRLALNESNLDINQLLRETTNELQNTAGKHAIELNLEDIPTIKGDKERLQQVFVNLISNAIKYSPEANQVLVKTYQDNSNINIEVQDFGIGIDTESQSKVFDRFFRVSNAQTATFPGLGLGLYISMQIVRQHKGTIKIKSEKGKGSVFTVVLPVEH